MHQTATKKGPRAASTYRCARRNNFVAVRIGVTRFDGWNAWIHANKKARPDKPAAPRAYVPPTRPNKRVRA